MIADDTPIWHLTVGQFKSLMKQNFDPQVPAPRNDIPAIFGIDTLIQMTGYSKPSIYSKTSRNQIPHFRRDGRLFFKHDEIMEWLTANRIETETEAIDRMDREFTKKRKAWK